MTKEMENVEVSFPQYKLKTTIHKNSTILEALRKVGIGIRSVCGGKGFCGKCKVLVKGGIE
ncbi:MAG: 2Fe-2S iron-sulfur cluster-binding protein, partial [Candidatus Methanomethylicia archaeon]